MKRPLLTDYDSFPLPTVTPTEIARFVTCDVRTILRMIDAGSLHAFRVGRHWRIPITEARRAFPVERRRHPS